MAGPPSVGPQPVGWSTVNCLFQHLHELSCIRIGAVVRRIRDHRKESHAVMPPGCLLHIEIDKLRPHMIAYSLTSYGVRCILSEELRPVVQCPAGRTLVRDKAYDKFLSAALYAQKSAYSLFLRDAFQGEPRADAQHNLIHHLIAQRPVDLPADKRFPEMVDYGLHPFPVPVMAEHKHY